MPTQLRAAREPVSTDALFNDGSSGEYEMSARKRRSAETHNKNPTSSFNRRVLVGSKIRDNNFIRAYLSSRESLTRDAASSPEPLNYATAPLLNTHELVHRTDLVSPKI